jgi:hypothetical protein
MVFLEIVLAPLPELFHKTNIFTEQICELHSVISKRIVYVPFYYNNAF